MGYSRTPQPLLGVLGLARKMTSTKPFAAPAAMPDCIGMTAHVVRSKKSARPVRPHRAAADRWITAGQSTIHGRGVYARELIPDGTPRKLMDVSRLTALGWQARISLREGIAKTYASDLAEKSAGALRA